MFEFTFTIPDYEKPEEAKTVTLVFRNYGDAPGRISRHNIGFVERQVWEYLEWGLVTPRHWPEGSKMPGHSIFDEIPQQQITKCYNAWQAKSFEDEAKAEAEKENEKSGGTS